MTPETVLKVGGSLYDLPDLGPRLKAWLEAKGKHRMLLVPGGGDTANSVRAFHRVHRLSEEACHWLALRALALNAFFLADLLGGAPVAGGPDQPTAICSSSWIHILDPYQFALADERRPGRLPHSWAVTSDSLAARAAVVFGCRRLILLKSVTMPPEMGWPEASRRGHVDSTFPDVVATAPNLKVEVVNFRQRP
jgi:5-(aminomethyl)-3-furanmethanol phosphate kinase